MSRVRVISTVNCIGLDAGKHAEIELNEKSEALIRAGLLLMLRPSDGQDVPE